MFTKEHYKYLKILADNGATSSNPKTFEELNINFDDFNELFFKTTNAEAYACVEYDYSRVDKTVFINGYGISCLQELERAFEEERINRNHQSLNTKLSIATFITAVISIIIAVISLFR